MYVDIKDDDGLQPVVHVRRPPKDAMSHDNFMNASRDDVLNYLKDKPIGEAIFRPSASHPDDVTLTMKVFHSLHGYGDLGGQ